MVGGRVSNFFKDFAIHEIVRICKISQTLWVDTQCDHNERKKHFEGWSIQHNNHRTCIFPHLKSWTWTPSQVKRLNLTSKNLHVEKNIVVNIANHIGGLTLFPRLKIQSNTFVTQFAWLQTLHSKFSPTLAKLSLGLKEVEPFII
jgi:hypothetical protein